MGWIDSEIQTYVELGFYWLPVLSTCAFCWLNFVYELHNCGRGEGCK